MPETVAGSLHLELHSGEVFAYRQDELDLNIFTRDEKLLHLHTRETRSLFYLIPNDLPRKLVPIPLVCFLSPGKH